MAGIIIVILLLFLLFFILTRRVWVKFVSEEELTIEIHMPIFSLQINNNGKNKKGKKSSDEKLSYLAYLRIISAVVDTIKTSRIEIKKISIPINNEIDSPGWFIKPVGYQYGLFSFIAYLRTKTEKITIEDNAFILSPDIDKIHFHLTVKSRIYEVIHAALTYKKEVVKEMKRARMN